jgi:hypothetical protein
MSEMSPVVPQVIAPPADQQKHEEMLRELKAAQLRASIKSCANWFYWIAGLSLVNSVSAMSGSNWRFILGLGITQIVDAVVQELGSVGHMAAFVIDVFIAGVFILFGYLSNQHKRWAFMLGMVLFGIDTLILLIGMDILGIAFHIYALYWILKGYQFVGQLQVLEPAPRQGF